MSDDLVQQIVDCAREKWPEARWITVYTEGWFWAGGQDDGIEDIGGPELVAEANHIEIGRMSARSCERLLAKFKET